MEKSSDCCCYHGENQCLLLLPRLRDEQLATLVSYCDEELWSRSRWRLTPQWSPGYCRLRLTEWTKVDCLDALGQWQTKFHLTLEQTRTLKTCCKSAGVQLAERCACRWLAGVTRIPPVFCVMPPGSGPFHYSDICGTWHIQSEFS